MLFILTLLACEPMGPVEVTNNEIITEEFNTDDLPTLTDVDILSVNSCQVYSDGTLGCMSSGWSDSNGTITLDAQGDIVRVTYVNQ